MRGLTGMRRITCKAIRRLEAFALVDCGGDFLPGIYRVDGGDRQWLGRVVHSDTCVVGGRSLQHTPSLSGLYLRCRLATHAGSARGESELHAPTGGHAVKGSPLRRRHTRHSQAPMRARPAVNTGTRVAMAGETPVHRSPTDPYIRWFLAPERSVRMSFPRECCAPCAPLHA